MNLRQCFTEHPASVNETYAQHFRAAAGIGMTMIGGGLACFAHALLPFTLVTRGSEIIIRLHERIVTQGRGAMDHSSRDRDAQAARRND